MSDEAIA